MLGLILGVLVIILGAKAFTPTGLPLTKDKNLTGLTAKVIGVVCILLGVRLSPMACWHRSASSACWAMMDHEECSLFPNPAKAAGLFRT